MSMNFEEFKEAIAEKVKDFLPEKFEDSNIDFKEVLKNNDTVLNAIVIQNPDTNIAPTIYIDKMFEQAQNGKDIDSIAGDIADIYISNSMDKDMDISNITEFDKAKDMIVPRLINAEENQELLKDRPHKLMDDLAVTYHVQLESNDMGSASVAVTNAIMQLYDVSVDELHEAAIANLDEKMTPTLRGMNEVVMEMMMKDAVEMCGGNEAAAREMVEDMIPEGDIPMFVLSDSNYVNGATVALSEKAMEMVQEKVGDEFYVLPSSVHELLIIPKDENADLASLESMVQEVNATQVAPEERLSDHVYLYDANEKELFRADRAEEHEQKVEQKREQKQEKSQDKEKSHERVSVKDKLAEKKVKAAEINKDREKSHEKEKAVML